MTPRDRTGRTRRRSPARLDAAALERAALDYLSRYSASEADLRRVLTARVRRTARAAADDAQADDTAASDTAADDAGDDSGDWPAARQADIDALIDRFRRQGLLDDARFAAARAASLNRRGQSVRAIRFSLLAHGVEGEDAGKAVATLGDATRGDATGDPDLYAAARLCRRRRLGPFRAPDQRAAWRNRDLGVLARAGFAADVARAVVDAGSADDILALAGDRAL